MSDYVIAIPATLTVQQKLDHFFVAALEKKSEGTPVMYMQIMDEVTDRVISLFLLEPAEIAKFSPVMMKIVNFASGLASKTSSSLTAQIFKKGSREQMHNVAEFWQRILWWAPHNDVHAYMAVPIDTAFATEFYQISDHCRAGKGKEHADMGIRLCKRFADLLIDDLFLAPTEYMGMGMVMRKIVSVGVDAVKKAVHEMINKVMKDVTEAQMAEFVYHYEKMVLARTA